MSPNNPVAPVDLKPEIRPSSVTSEPHSLLFALILTLGAIALDQFEAPILFTTTPLWGTVAVLLLIWRRGTASLSRLEPAKFPVLSNARVAAFLTGHIFLVLATRSLSFELQPMAGTATIGGTLVAVLKLSVFVPTLILLPISAWRRLVEEYSSEFIAGIVVLVTYFPRRLLASIWPWYGQVLGRFVFFVASTMVSGLGYVRELTPTLTGRELDVTIIQACSGINGVELFQFLFGLLVFCDWNRLRKGRTLVGYFAGLGFMLMGNSLRIITLVVVGNHGLSGVVSRFRISAGWIFFSLIFLGYLSLAYHWMLGRRKIPGGPIHLNERSL